MAATDDTAPETPESNDADQAAVAACLADCARRAATITYRDLAAAAGFEGGHSIHRTVLALEDLAAADHEAGRPLRAALAVSKTRGGLPAPGFFEMLRQLGRYAGPDEGPKAMLAHQIECRAVWRAYGATDDAGRESG